ncbi:MAG: zinc-binding alcohol dehydrogenase family protein [Pseudomonadales bacterium]|nr:zinc-binding alcohol dehydrogenase family protein [Pseudomonadales bacterium]
MKAVGVYNSLPIGKENSLQDVEIASPEPGPGELLVKVYAVSVNPVDAKIRMAAGSNLAQPRILGWDCAGVVQAVGAGCQRFKAGDEVYYAGDVTRAGCNSELHLVDERIVGRKPVSLSFEDAAAMPLTTITAWESLFERMHIEQNPAANKGRTLLIIGAAGGVGSIAIQLAKEVAGLTVIATASRPETVQWCRELGADHVINHKQTLSDELKALGIEGVDDIFCLSGTAQHWHAMADIIKPQGSICLIVDSENNQPLNINLFKPKSVGIVWEFMFTRARFATHDMAAQGALLDAAAALFEKGILRHTRTEHMRPMNAENLRKAHARMESGTMIGKLVLSME